MQVVAVVPPIQRGKGLLLQLASGNVFNAHSLFQGEFAAFANPHMGNHKRWDDESDLQNNSEDHTVTAKSLACQAALHPLSSPTATAPPPPEPPPLPTNLLTTLLKERLLDPFHSVHLSPSFFPFQPPLKLAKLMIIPPQPICILRPCLAFSHHPLVSIRKEKGVN